MTGQQIWVTLLVVDGVVIVAGLALLIALSWAGALS